jgi:uncharacterized protein (DUF2237 family)
MTTAPNPASPEALLPRVRPGDRWSFATRVPGSADVLRLRHVVQSVGTDGRIAVQVTNLARPDAAPLAQVLDREMNRVSREFAPGEAVHYAPAFAMFRFPMAPGRRWKLAVQQTQEPADPPTEIGIEAEVLRWETVQVPAGRFDALRVQARHTVDDLVVQSTYWYAPKAARAVRGIELTLTAQGRSELQYELLDLWRQG